MDYRLAKFAAAGAITGLLGIGGISLASAQETTGSTSSTVASTDSTTADTTAGTPAPAAADADHDGKDCPKHDGTAPAAADSSTSSTADAAS